MLDSSLLLTKANFKDKTGCVIKVAEYLREEIIEYCNELSGSKELVENERFLPANLQILLRSIFYHYVNKAKLSETIEWAVNSIDSDIVAGVTLRKALMLKPFFFDLANVVTPVNASQWRSWTV